MVDLGLAAAAVGHAVLIHLQAGLIAELDTWERLRRAKKTCSGKVNRQRQRKTFYGKENGMDNGKIEKQLK